MKTDVCVERKTKKETTNIPDNVKSKEYEDDDMLTPEEVCALIGGITTKTLCDWNNHHRHKEILAPIKFTSKVVRYEYKNVKAFIEKCKSTY
ncbi:hypothetical protein KC999_05475 [Proteus mirabilis]|uniref:hypothetical protein n=1 Tax=Proteus TaxID=583 RepID=UPI000537B9EF|nr:MULTISPECIES: hypothetical protein [Proteus]AUU36036.1 hypothetical protein MC72_011935 [Proteus mirabilis]MBF0799625.1 hypothetical protein [Proteus mirabilis]MDM3668735.1 hypothetical protein [Proteus mirabilis]MDM3728912.1 hypothetical protein [Proteus mirabilis]ROD54256.1 hypothetical protein C4Z11_000230 [Proteus mirabilis]